MLARTFTRSRGWLFSAMLAALAGCSEDPLERAPRSTDEPALGAAVQPLLQSIERAKLVPSKPNPDGNFGTSVALDGDTAVVGMHWSAGTDKNVGAAYVFEYSGGFWKEKAELKAPDTVFVDTFGEAVALDGDLLAVGSSYIDGDSSAVFTYKRSGGAWIEDAKLVATDGLASSRFGASVALAGDTLVVGDADSGDGAAYVFVRNGGVWSQEARIAWEAQPEEDPGDVFVAVSADTAVLASALWVRIYVRSGAVWSEQAEINVGRFITAVAVDGDTALFGAPLSCSVFSRAGGVWTKEADLWPLQNVVLEPFGASVALDGDRALVGAAEEYSNWGGSGFAYTFRRSGGAWEQEAVITTNEPVYGGWFGSSVALSGETMLVGAPDEDALIASSGAVYVLELAPGLENGAPCEKAAVCASGFCTDGVCCDALCEGTCSSCVGAKKGGGLDGICAPIAAGIDPDAECAEQAAASCGMTGVCDGSGACERSAIGAACDDGDGCTEGDVCVEGGCAGKPRSCAPPDACHLAGQCNTSTGVCEYALINPTDPACAPVASCGCATPGAEVASDARWMLVATALGLGRWRRRRSPQGARREWPEPHSRAGTPCRAPTGSPNRRTG